jgi:hypothetical protein
MVFSVPSQRVATLQMKSVTNCKDTYSGQFWTARHRVENFVGRIHELSADGQVNPANLDEATRTHSGKADLNGPGARPTVSTTFGTTFRAELRENYSVNLLNGRTRECRFFFEPQDNGDNNYAPVRHNRLTQQDAEPKFRVCQRQRGRNPATGQRRNGSTILRLEDLASLTIGRDMKAPCWMTDFG